jgi:hypothetical protein
MKKTNSIRFGVYKNWAALDPLFMVRMFWQGCHPNSPLSHPALTKQAFFSDSIADSYVVAFQKRICRYESFLWPWGMMYPFSNATRVVRQIFGGNGGEKILVMSGTGDKLMTIPVMKELAARYREAYDGLDETGVMLDKVDAKALGGGYAGSRGRGVRAVFVPRAGHHLQNDVQWEDGAWELLQFYRQL